MPEERKGAVTMRGNPLTLVGPQIKVGDKAPDFKALDTKMQEVNLASAKGKTRIFSVIPSLDTPVCDLQTKRFNDESGKAGNLTIYTVSMDLPFAQKRWCGAFGVDHSGQVAASERRERNERNVVRRAPRDHRRLHRRPEDAVRSLQRMERHAGRAPLVELLDGAPGAEAAAEEATVSA